MVELGCQAAASVHLKKLQYAMHVCLLVANDLLDGQNAAERHMHVTHNQDAATLIMPSNIPQNGNESQEMVKSS